MPATKGNPVAYRVRQEEGIGDEPRGAVRPAHASVRRRPNESGRPTQGRRLWPGERDRLHGDGTYLAPLQHSFSIYLALTEGRGTGEARIVVTSADTGQPTYIGRPHRIEFDANPLKVKGVIFRIASCAFPQPGLYWVEFRFNDYTLTRQPLLVR